MMNGSFILINGKLTCDLRTHANPLPESWRFRYFLEKMPVTVNTNDSGHSGGNPQYKGKRTLPCGVL